MKRVGIMGGTFNPVHNAHICMAQAACEQYDLDEVLFMPSKHPPHKDNREIASDEHRRRMIEFAIDGIEKFTFSDFELRHEGTTYTCETLERLKKEHPDWKLYFILGGDSLLHFTEWYHPERIVSQAVILAASREGVGKKETKKLCESYMEKMGGEIFLIDMPQIRISSSAIRKICADGGSLAGICPDKAECYIKLHGLYGMPVLRHRSDKKGKLPKRIPEELYQSLGSTLRPGRYRHTIGVSLTAAAMAWQYGEGEQDAKRAELAGLLHDCAKYLTPEEMFRECDRYGIALSEVECQNPALIHGKLGSVYAKERYGVTDEEILSAISCHTTGKPDMTVLEKIIYIADYIEPQRQMDCHPYTLADIRRMAFCDLDETMFMILENTLSYLKKTDRPIDEGSVETYEYYKEGRKK